MKISVIIVNYKTKNITSDCIESMLRFTREIDLEILVVDNNSGEDNVTYLEKKFFNKVKIIPNKKNIGFGAANNKGIKVASGDIVLFLNSDTIIKDNIFIKILENFGNKKVGVVSPLLFNNKGEVQKFSYGKFPTLSKDIFRDNYKFKKEFSVIIEVDWVSGAAMAVRKNIFEEIGGFDENFFMYFEDIDLCHRIKDKGYDVVVDKDISIVHLGGGSVKKHNERKKMYYKSQNYYYKKHHGLFTMILMKCFRAPYRLINYILNK